MSEITRLVSEQLTALEAEYGERLEAVSVAAWLQLEDGGETEVRLHFVARPGHRDRLGWLPAAVFVPPQAPRDD